MKPEIVVVEPGHSLYEAILSLRNERVHRLLVVDNDEGSALYILTYKRILRYLHQSVRTISYDVLLYQSVRTISYNVR